MCKKEYRGGDMSLLCDFVCRFLSAGQRTVFVSVAAALLLCASAVKAESPDYGNTWQTAYSASADVNIPGNVLNSSDVDYFKIQMGDGGKYNITVTLNGLYDSTLTLYDTDGTTQLDYNDDANGSLGLGSQIIYTCTKTGYYYCKVKGYSSYTGNYIFRVSTSTPPPTSPYLAPYPTQSSEVFFKDFNGDGRADLAVRSLAAGDVKVYFQTLYNPQPRLTNGNFETGTLTGWTKTGTAFNTSPTDNNGSTYNGGVALFNGWQDQKYVNTYFSGETATGTLTSAPFVLTSRYVDLLIAGWSAWGGGAYNYNYVTLHRASDNSELARVYTPNVTWMMSEMTLDGGQANVGQQVYIKVTDNGTLAGFSWIAVDRFRLGGQFSRYTFNTVPDINAPAASVPDVVNWGLFFADINGDGKADLINHNRVNGDLFMYYNTGAAFATSAVYLPARTPTGSQYRIFFADMNGDGFADLCVLNKNTGLLEAFNNTQSGNFNTGASISQNVGTGFASFDGHEPLLADITGDRKAEFVNFDQNSVSFSCYGNTGSGFATAATILTGPAERYEHQYFLEDCDGDGAADLVQLTLRTGDVIAHKIARRINGQLTLGESLFRSSSAPAFSLPSEGRRLLYRSARSVDVMLFYETNGGNLGTYVYGSNGLGTVDHGWWSLNPNYPNIVPNDGRIYRTATPLLGLYDSQDPNTLIQQAYWLHSMGVNVILLDWTNIPWQLAEPTRIQLETYQGISGFIPPRITVAMRMLASGASSDYTSTQQIADVAYDVYQRCPSMWYKISDGTADADKPVLVAFTDFNDAAWTTTGPTWRDSRFNMRYTNGYLMARPGMTTNVDADWNRVVNDLPYWNFVENAGISVGGVPTGYYGNMYRRLPGTEIAEQAATQMAIYTANPNAYSWDGQLDTVGGKYVIERFSKPMSVAGTTTKYPRVVWLNRWSYAAGWYDQPQEGLSLNYSMMIEPSVDLGFDNYDRAANMVYNLRGLVKQIPGKPIVCSVTSGTSVAFTSSGFPTQYRVGANSDCSDGTWQYIDINKTAITLPTALQNKPFYVQTKNSFGQSEIAHYGYNMSLLTTFAANWLQSCSSPFWCGGFDFDQNQTVDLKDFATMASEWVGF